jgi:hypothetical protein
LVLAKLASSIPAGKAAQGEPPWPSGVEVLRRPYAERVVAFDPLRGQVAFVFDDDSTRLLVMDSGAIVA